MELERLSHCIVCSSGDIEHYLDGKDYFVSQEQFNIHRCNRCGFLFTNPRPGIADISAYYESEEYVSHSKTSSGVVNRLFHIARLYTLSYKKRVLKKYSNGKVLLDYGCGTGDFVHVMENSGWQCFGVEPNPDARSLANIKCNSDIYDESDLDRIDKASLDSISLWHVLEHVYPILERIEQFYDILKPGGTLFVALPNMLSLDAKIYGPYWAAWDVPRHIYHFTPVTISSLLKQYGFELIRTRPMLLDAIYISMLSEKYRSGSPSNVKALFNGLHSNSSALFKDRNYSSLIYIFKKSN